MSTPTNFFQKLLPSQLPFPLAEGKKHNGIYADLDKAGYVTALHVYRQGQHLHSLVLQGDDFDGEAQVVEHFSYDPGLEFIDGWKNFDGSVTVVEDAAIDAMPDTEYAKYVRYINYVAWVREQAAALPALLEAKDAITACSFCGKDRTEVKQLIAGPNVSICNECVDLTQEILKAA